MGSPLWKRGVRGDFVKIFDSIGVLLNYSMTPPIFLPFASRAQAREAAPLA